tara:strand:+ start:57 stop:494 length:438 start_codon:yes stop_codon:yes gene_type:complete
MALTQVIGSGIGTVVSPTLTTAVATSEGGAVTTNIAQGLAKAWANYSGTGTSFRDSFNCASAVDNGTGNYDYNWTNDFSNENYSFSGQASYINGANASVLIMAQKNESAYGTSINAGDLNIQCSNQDMSAVDAGSTTINAYGDLA